MMRKQGITLISVTVAVIVLSILVGVITLSTFSTINYARLVTWVNEVTYVQDIVDEAKNTTLGVPYTTETVNIVVSNLSSEELNDQFSGENISSGKVELNVLNLGELKITNTKYGNLKTANDLYAYSTKTGKVYYAQGVEIDGVVYYTLTDELRNTFNLNLVNEQLTSVVFVPSAIGYTNQPIEVTVKLPTSFTNISITTSNTNVLVGGQTVVGTTYEYNVNTSKVAGNYDITVTYINGSQSYTTTYSVNGYDATKPVISSLTEENFIEAYSEEDNSYLTNIIANDESGIKYLKYSTGIVSEQNAQEYFSKNGNNVINGIINLNGEINEYTIYAQDDAGNFAILTFDKTDYISMPIPVPAEWKASVSKITIDGVPIPKGFVVSPYPDEGSKSKGLVIYALTVDEINLNRKDIASIDGSYQNSLESRNQFVWIPVDREKFTTDFKRYDFINATSNISYSLGTGFWETQITAENLPLNSQSATYLSTRTLAEVQEMYASVKKYGGFYIARYEAGKDDRGNVSVSMGKYPYNQIKWGTSMTNDTGGAVEISRNFYTYDTTAANYSKYGVISTLIYSVQWDRVLNWWKELDTNFSVTNSTSYGNYMDHAITANDWNANAQYAVGTSDSNGKVTLSSYRNTDSKPSKTLGDMWLVTTGGLNYTDIYNIYDLAGNLWEWTMEGRATTHRIYRGGSFSSTYGSTRPVAYRNYNCSPQYPDAHIGFRPTLYIK